MTERGFTLIEVLVGCALLALIAVALLPLLVAGRAAPTRIRDDATIAAQWRQLDRGTVRRAMAQPVTWTPMGGAAWVITSERLGNERNPQAVLVHARAAMGGRELGTQIRLIDLAER